MWRHDQDALVRLREVALWGPLHHQVFKMSAESIEGASCPSVISIPWLGDSGEGRLEVLDKGEVPGHMLSCQGDLPRSPPPCCTGSDPSRILT